MLNRIVLIGRLTKDPELRYTPNGVAVATFTLAVDRPFTNQSGEREADFINIVTWRGLAENCANYLKKGRLAAADGRLQIRNYENNEGKRVYVSEVVADNVRFLESGNSGQSGNNGNNGGQGGQRRGQQGDQQSNQRFNDDPFAKDGQPIDISDDDLPF
ncbi:single-strand DNA-binding protein [Evansella vedderi]|uniref:Single-stranded DNA-binding protein n=1 Tax=Evansella vedderi TaxID=38282 RepID=A0ABT9ZWD0_9BACI|nr:single-stranded DNA-binding protein [Evansella vedderi]MDQ0255529.1 single-strand DNA-binding protein [Evansella vedderi]